MSVTTTVTTNKKESQENKVVHNVFYIDMIPDAMRKMGWDVAPKLMNNWFGIFPSYAFTEESKKENLNADATKLESSRVNSDIVKMSWAINYEQVSSGIDTLCLYLIVIFVSGKLNITKEEILWFFLMCYGFFQRVMITRYF